MEKLNMASIVALLAFASFVTIGVLFVYKWALGMTSQKDRVLIAKEVIPLVTIGVIVAAVFALAVVGIMQENSVASIFAALAGYVLGKSSLNSSSTNPDRTHNNEDSTEEDKTQ